ncbi:protein IQ-DOMAIN 6 isoform X3 [Capsicum annuum]|uniref:protein IQ-DOMAIN 6 isoform X3 n=1 Tax=Capsicum annuum TaxID=4072 RepID=UPI0007BFC76C|nr:protein IQ-DOMAIN 6 isoform X3 [Capsicum annuum]
MGGSGKWIKALIGFKKSEKDDHEKTGGKGKKWKLWRGSSGDLGGSSWKGLKYRNGGDGSEGSDSSSVNNDAYTAAVATVVRAPPKDFRAVREEWAAIRIQTAFRGFLEGWCDSKGTLEEIKTKIHMRQEGVLKRERALAYAQAQKQSKSSQNFDSRTAISVPSFKGLDYDKSNCGWSWLERWMAARPWENRLMEQTYTDSLETTPKSKACLETLKDKVNQLKISEICFIKVKKNNVTKRISAKPPLVGHTTRSSSSPSSEFRYDDSTSSSFCTSTTPISGNTMLASDRTEDSNSGKPNYMSLTESTKAKQRNQSILRQSMDEFQFLKLINGDSKSCAGCHPSVNFSRPLCLPTRMDKFSRLGDKRNCVFE